MPGLSVRQELESAEKDKKSNSPIILLMLLQKQKAKSILQITYIL